MSCRTKNVKREMFCSLRVQTRKQRLRCTKEKLIYHLQYLQEITEKKETLEIITKIVILLPTSKIYHFLPPAVHHYHWFYLTLTAVVLIQLIKSRPTPMFHCEKYYLPHPIPVLQIPPGQILVLTENHLWNQNQNN